MRKRTINFVADTIFWYIIYFLPILSYLLFCFTEPISGVSAEIMPFGTYLNTAFHFIQGDLIYPVITEIFGSSGLFPLGVDPALFTFLTWFIGTVIIHLFVDILLFIPRLSHKYMKSFTQGDN